MLSPSPWPLGFLHFRGEPKSIRSTTHSLYGLRGVLIKEIPQGLIVHFSKHIGVIWCVLNQQGLNEITPESILVNAPQIPGLDELTWTLSPEKVSCDHNQAVIRHLVINVCNRLHKGCCRLPSENPIKGVTSFMSRFRGKLEQARRISQPLKTRCFGVILIDKVNTEVTMEEHIFKWY